MLSAKPVNWPGLKVCNCTSVVVWLFNVGCHRAQIKNRHVHVLLQLCILMQIWLYLMSCYWVLFGPQGQRRPPPSLSLSVPLENSSDPEICFSRCLSPAHFNRCIYPFNGQFGLVCLWYSSIKSNRPGIFWTFLVPWGGKYAPICFFLELLDIVLKMG